jgi:U3 small nucleolar RNA-associated protein 14
LEVSVDNILKAAKLRHEDLQKSAELEMNHLSVEEVATRRAELRKMRELLFRAGAKAKRVAKIKSKTYRRLKKRERAKVAAALDEEPDDDDEATRLKKELDRARERATLRHKHTGKWAKAMLGRNELDVDERREISMMLERGELLRKKIRGERGSADEQDEGEDEDDDSDEEGETSVSTIKASAFDELAMLAKDAIPVGVSGNGTGLFDMKFMKDGMARDKMQADRLVDDFIAEMGGDPNMGGGDEVNSNGGGEASLNGVAVQRQGGRVVYNPGETVCILFYLLFRN